MFGLVDCNNFYASCERLFRPDLNGRPIVVLSNNDGCVVARSAEAKAMGIKMGVPYFEVKHLVNQAGLVVFSSNYALYGDMSRRVMTTLEHFTPDVEVYSIDEAFLSLAGFGRYDLADMGREIRYTVNRNQGLPVCVGIASTKTLAKLANHAAKRWPATGGVVLLEDRDRQRKLLSLLPVDEVWGIGRRLTKRLGCLGIETALDLANANPRRMKRKFSVVLERTIRELNGEPCLELDLIPQPRQQIISSRSFGERVTRFTAMRQALATHAYRAAEKMREDGTACQAISIFIRTSHFTANEPHYGNSATARFMAPTCDARDLCTMSRHLLDTIWRDGYRYAKAGVMLHDILSPHHYQEDLFVKDTRNPAVMATMDRINLLAKGKVWLAAQGMNPDPAFGMKRVHLSPSYTTQLHDLPKVK